MQSTGFPKNLRLLDSKAYQKVFDQPDLKVHSTHLLLLARKNQTSFPRLGLAISKKRAHLAVTRNQLKRQAREVFRLHQHQLKNYDLIVLAKKNINKHKSNEIRQQYLSIFKQLLAKQG